MYPVTQAFKDKIKELNRTFKIEITINHSTGTLVLTDEDIVEGSVVYTQKSQNGDEFACGGAVGNTLDFNIIRKPEYDSISFKGAKVTGSVGIVTTDWADSFEAFLNPNTPAFYDVKYEYVPFGTFNIDDITKLTSTYEIKCVDNMLNLDRPYSESSLSYPATLEQIYLEICTFGDMTAGTLSFPNDSYTVQEKPTGDFSYRDMLMWVAELSGTFATVTRTNELILTWYNTTPVETYTGNNRFDYKVKEHDVEITGIQFETDDVVYLAGTDTYVLDLSENPLLSSDYATVLNNILSNVSGISFRPYETNWQGNPALDVGDFVTHEATDGSIYNQPITQTKYKYRGKSLMSGQGKSQQEQGYKGSTDKRLEIIRKQIEDKVGNQVTDLEQAILDATDLLTTELGGYVLKRENELLIMDNPDPDLAVKVWRWNLGGLGYSTTGVNGTYGTAITMNGAIVADYITTGTLSADRVRAGSIISEGADILIDLDNDTFNFKNQFTWNGTENRVELGSGTLLVAPTINAGTINSVNINGSTITGTLFRTDVDDARRIEIDSDGLKSYNADNFLQGVSILPLTNFGKITINSGFEPYSNTKTYTRGDRVSYLTGGYIKIGRTDITGVLPTNTTYWEQVVPNGGDLSILEVEFGEVIDDNLFSFPREFVGIKSFNKTIELYASGSYESAGSVIVNAPHGEFYVETGDGMTVFGNAGDIRLNSDVSIVLDSPEVTIGGDNTINTRVGDLYIKAQDGDGIISMWAYRVAVDGTFVHSSDIKLKENIIDIPSKLLEVADDIKLVDFNFKKSPEKQQIGSIAQWVEESFIKFGLDPEEYSLVDTIDDSDGGSSKYVNYNELSLLKIALLEKKVKELQERVGI